MGAPARPAAASLGQIVRTLLVERTPAPRCARAGRGWKRSYTSAERRIRRLWLTDCSSWLRFVGNQEKRFRNKWSVPGVGWNKRSGSTGRTATGSVNPRKAWLDEQSVRSAELCAGPWRAPQRRAGNVPTRLPVIQPPQITPAYRGRGSARRRSVSTPSWPRGGRRRPLPAVRPAGTAESSTATTQARSHDPALLAIRRRCAPTTPTAQPRAPTFACTCYSTRDTCCWLAPCSRSRVR